MPDKMPQENGQNSLRNYAKLKFSGFLMVTMVSEHCTLSRALVFLVRTALVAFAFIVEELRDGKVNERLRPVGSHGMGVRCKGRHRILRRTLELLRQVSLVPYVSEGVARRARDALRAMDRYPLADNAILGAAVEEEAAPGQVEASQP